MATSDFLLPDVGEGLTEAEIVEWRVKAGETVRFRVRNDGQLPHEMVIGTLDELQAHAEQMRDMPGMPHDEPNAVALDAGQQGDLLWHFSQPATLDFACLIAGHLEA